MRLTLTEGAVFAGRYRVGRAIASGAMGVVYEVVHIETDRRRALKVMLPHIAESAEFRDRFKLEARIAARVESDFIVEVFDAGIDDTTGAPFLVMELLRGEELGKRVRRVGRMPPDEAIVYLHQTALALDKTHRAQIVHRDLKPGNLFLTERDDGTPRIKVLDFGVAKLVADVSTGAAATTATVGTPLYMAPEQFRGGAVTSAADVFALGMIAYTLLVGRAYWTEELREGGHVIAFAMVAVLGPKEPASARARRAGVELPPRFDAWFAKVTALEPRDRFRSAFAAIGALAEVYGLPPLAAPTSSSGGSSPRSSPSVELGSIREATSIDGASFTHAQLAQRSRRLVTGALVALGVAAAVAVLLLAGRDARSPDAPRAEGTSLQQPIASSSSLAPTVQPSTQDVQDAEVASQPRPAAAVSVIPDSARALRKASSSSPAASGRKATQAVAPARAAPQARSAKSPLPIYAPD